MKQAVFARCLKVLTVIVGLIALTFFLIIPYIIHDFGNSYPEFSHLVLPSTVAVWVSAIPIYTALYLFWRICTQIGRDQSFSKENIRALQLISVLAIVDTLLCLGVTMWLASYHAINGGVAIFAFAIMTAGISVAIISLTLSYLTQKAMKLKEENDLTV